MKGEVIVDLSAQHQRLLRMLEEARSTGPTDEDSKSSLKDYHHELTVFDNHPADFATEDYMRNLDAALRENDNRIVDLIENALSRIDRGEYEYCSECGQKIDSQRLETLPYVDTCRTCAQQGLGGLGKQPTKPEFPEDATWPKFNQFGTSDSIQDQPRQVRDKDWPDA